MLERTYVDGRQIKGLKIPRSLRPCRFESGPGYKI